MKNVDPANEQFYRFIADTNEARGAFDQLINENIIALDTETCWEGAGKQSRVSLVQVAARTGEVIVVDALAVDLEALRPLVESPTVLTAAHNARFDAVMLARAGLRPAAFVDTLYLARAVLSLPSYSLAAVAAHLLGVQLDKDFQKTNWRRRPLTTAQIGYAATDAEVTLRVYEKLHRLLEEQGRLQEVMAAATLQEINDTAPATGRGRRRGGRGNPQHPVTPLTKEEKRAVAHLKEWRLRRAHELRKPAYMICPDRTLEDLVRTRPTTLDNLSSIYGLGETKITRFGENLLEALREALRGKDEG